MWAGEEGDRQAQVGRCVWFSLAGPAEHLIARLRQIVADYPDLDPRDLRGSLMLMVAPGITEVEAEALQERADSTRSDDE